MQEYLEKNYKDEMPETECLSLALSALNEVVETGKRNIDVAVVKRYNVQFLTEEHIQQHVTPYLHPIYTLFTPTLHPLSPTFTQVYPFTRGLLVLGEKKGGFGGVWRDFRV